MLFTYITHAAELRGRLTGLSGASVTVKCKNFSNSRSIGKNGTYAILGLPSGKDCSFTVSRKDAVSAPIPFSTSKSVTIYNGRLKQYKKRIIVIRK
jgi:hypothetical protein